MNTNSDHKLVILTMKIQGSKWTQTLKKPEDTKINTQKLKEEGVQQEYSHDIDTKIRNYNQNEQYCLHNEQTRETKDIQVLHNETEQSTGSHHQEKTTSLIKKQRKLKNIIQCCKDPKKKEELKKERNSILKLLHRNKKECSASNTSSLNTATQNETSKNGNKQEQNKDNEEETIHKYDPQQPQCNNNHAAEQLTNTDNKWNTLKEYILTAAN